MEKVRHKLRDLSILSTFVLLAVAFLLLAMLLVEVEKTMLTNAQRDIAFQYSEIVEGFNAVKVWGDQSVFPLSEHDGKVMWLYEMAIWTLPPLTCLVCFILAGVVFYRSKIKKPLMLLTASASRIAANDLDFSISCDRNDEMGLLCKAFEKMRSALENNNREMWRQMNERKKLNAAFSHDLRTPLTVIEGHLGILQKYTPQGKISVDDAMQTYTAMTGQIERLKNYASSMNTLQRLEDIPIVRKQLAANSFTARLGDTAEMICKSKTLTISDKTAVENIRVDPEIVMQVFENLLSNAARYAKASISIQYAVDKETFSITVTDDGEGFRDTALKSATNPFYTTEKKSDTVQHFGLGLNICKILCERHGGNILLSNDIKMGASVTAYFGMTE
ncbi:MAG TPA: HAMP domain-containing histidine kinase [Candidatus Eisenbergiella merdavium]|uniref:histidine kinase n=1 Tax=Candidatus Eisenbergiella merdavium TaxID=2838551 RepID=A0A9D2NEC1_9FIRM|nr:HAMP domain-containing histidine kinase [Candidatus Eisenbergiella merdavium]